jgi:hypothetical protein
VGGERHHLSDKIRPQVLKPNFSTLSVNEVHTCFYHSLLIMSSVFMFSHKSFLCYHMHSVVQDIPTLVICLNKLCLFLCFECVGDCSYKLKKMVLLCIFSFPFFLYLCNLQTGYSCPCRD